MHNPESVLENEMHKLRWDFEKLSDHQISTRSYNNNKQQKKRTYSIVDFAALADHRVKLKECKKRDKYLNLARELKKLEHESDDYTNCNWCSWYSHQRIGTRTRRLGNNGTGGYCPNYSIIEIDQNTEKSPGDLRRLVVTQIPVGNHQLTLV